MTPNLRNLYHRALPTAAYTLSPYFFVSDIIFLIISRTKNIFLKQIVKWALVLLTL